MFITFTVDLNATSATTDSMFEFFTALNNAVSPSYSNKRNTLTQEAEGKTYIVVYVYSTPILMFFN